MVIGNNLGNALLSFRAGELKATGGIRCGLEERVGAFPVSTLYLVPLVAASESNNCERSERFNRPLARLSVR